MKILLVGQGNMATAVAKLCKQKNIDCHWNKELLIFFPKDYYPPQLIEDKMVAIHFGSGRLLPQLIELCESNQIPIIQGSTKLTHPVPENPKTAIINAPNLSLPVIRFMMAFPDFAAAIKPGMEFGIVESHQEKKADTSGTARMIAKLMGIAETAICSIRKPFEQLSFGVPQEHLNGHAYHNFIFKGQGVEIGSYLRIHSRDTYADGALTLAQPLVENPLMPGIHQLKDIMHLLPKE